MRKTLWVALALCAAGRLTAQCPDGTPKPCGNSGNAAVRRVTLALEGYAAELGAAAKRLQPPRPRPTRPRPGPAPTPAPTHGATATTATALRRPGRHRVLVLAYPNPSLRLAA